MMRIGGAYYKGLLRRVSALCAAVLTVVSLAPRSGASAATLQTLYSFGAQVNGADGAHPLAGVIMDKSGHLYGTTAQGGGSHGFGTVFELTPNGAETVLYEFCSQGGNACTDGAFPEAGLIMDKSGHLYGTTASPSDTAGGTVFELTPHAGKTKWTEKVLHTFCAQQGDCADGSLPKANLIMDASGHLYGTTEGGGVHGVGTVFELSPNAAKTKWRERVLYSFGVGTLDGARPVAGLIMDTAENLYGTTSSGGEFSTDGTVFELIPNAGKTKWRERVLYRFCPHSGCTDGEFPRAGLMMNAGNLYGTTASAGAYGYGTVFELTPNATKTKWAETVLHSFCAPCTDGNSPLGGVIMDAAGSLYGTTELGGAYAYYGAVFKLTPNAAETKWAETVPHSFCPQVQSLCPDGSNPEAGLIIDAAGNFYGTTYYGGDNGTNSGTVFELTP